MASLLHMAENYIENMTVIFRQVSVLDPKSHRSEGTLLTGESQWTFLTGSGDVSWINTAVQLESFKDNYLFIVHCQCLHQAA